MYQIVPVTDVGDISVVVTYLGSLGWALLGGLAYAWLGLKGEGCAGTSG